MRLFISVDSIKFVNNSSTVGLINGGNFAEPYFTYDRCPYIRMKRLRGERITKKTISQNRSYLDTHIIPALGTHILGVLTTASIEAFLLSLKDQKNLANMTIYNVLNCLRILTGETIRAGHIKTDQARNVRPLLAGNGGRGILTPEEVKGLLFQPEKCRSQATYAINLTAATTGARLGELRG